VTLEEFLLEDEHTTNQCRAANMKLMEFMCQKETLRKLVGYATQVPTNPNNHDQSHKFPFVAADVLTSSKTIAQALCEGGWASKTEEPEEEEKKNNDEDDFDDDKAENKMVQSILSNQSDKEEKSDKECLVEELE